MKTSSNVLFTAGEYEVRLVEVLDTRIPPEPGSTKECGIGAAYGIIHAPTGVLNGTTALYYAAIRAAWSLNDDLQKALKDPRAEESPQGFMPPGFGN